MLFLCLSVGLGIKIQRKSELCQFMALLGRIKIKNWDSHQDQEVVLIDDVEVLVISVCLKVIILLKVPLLDYKILMSIYKLKLNNMNCF